MCDELGARVTYTPEDFVRNSKYIQSRQGLLKYSFFIAVGVVVCILLFFYILDPARFVQTFSQPKNFSVFIIALLIVGSWGFFKQKTSGFFLKRKFEKQIKSSPALGEPQFILFDEDGMYGTNQFGSGQTKWQGMNEVTETEEDFFFFTSKNFAQFVPKRFFKEKQINQIRELAKKHLSEKAKV